MSTITEPAEDAFKVAEKRGYAKGYTAGKARKVREVSRDEIRRREDAFWQRAFLVALDFALKQSGWVVGTKPINTLEERTQLASDAANAALKKAIFDGRLLR